MPQEYAFTTVPEWLLMQLPALSPLIGGAVIIAALYIFLESRF